MPRPTCRSSGFPAHAGMDPLERGPQPWAQRLPRTRGDGPAPARERSSPSPASPHTRGWTRSSGRRGSRRSGFPAHAGMDPRRRPRPRRDTGLPRTRGDGPLGPRRRGDRGAASPHTRGWTPDRRSPGRLHAGFPAHAGMDPAGGGAPHRRRRLPRTRGDGPAVASSIVIDTGASPHTRGWTLYANEAQSNDAGFPAHAGMDPPAAVGPAQQGGLPRTRGDGPGRKPTFPTLTSASPHTRGWTRGDPAALRRPGGFPAHAGMDRAHFAPRGLRPRLPRTRGDGPEVEADLAGGEGASPHTRGWTVFVSGAGGGRMGFPAHAGMDPSQQFDRNARKGLPRTRGDGPQAVRIRPPPLPASPHTRGWTLPAPQADISAAGFPAHAGMDRLAVPLRGASGGLPRTRGDGPNSRRTPPSPNSASPHTRGWTPSTPGGAGSAPGFPAHAGMDPQIPVRASGATGLPRTRGDGPRTLPPAMRTVMASPHTRGWTCSEIAVPRSPYGFPAHAGMDPPAPAASRRRLRLPRTRGDGPSVRPGRLTRNQASPHTRGWTPVRPRAEARLRGFPAHAGMDLPRRG